MGLKPPEPITAEHLVDDFDCGNEQLGSWLRRRALQNHRSGATRVYVVCATRTQRIAGYYGLATAEIQHEKLPSRSRRNMPDPVPALLLGRLAVSLDHQGKGLGADLLAHAVQRSLDVSKIVGVRLLLVHAFDENAAAFYRHNGFSLLPGQVRTLALDLIRLRSKMSP
jgi:GNAT superfamily N-acetyltransferase